MGKVVPFSPRMAPEQVEAALIAAGEQFQRRIRAREELPRILAALIESGHSDLALQVMLAWGRGEADPDDLLDICQQAAAVAGLQEEQP